MNRQRNKWRLFVASILMAAPLQALSAALSELEEDVFIDNMRCIQSCIVNADPSSPEKARMLLMGALADKYEALVSGRECLDHDDARAQINQRAKAYVPALPIKLREITVFDHSYICAYAKR